MQLVIHQGWFHLGLVQAGRNQEVIQSIFCLKVQGLTSWVFKTSKGAGCPALLGNLSHCLTMTPVLKIAVMSGIYLRDKCCNMENFLMALVVRRLQ